MSKRINKLTGKSETRFPVLSGDWKDLKPPLYKGGVSVSGHFLEPPGEVSSQAENDQDHPPWCASIDGEECDCEDRPKPEGQTVETPLARIMQAYERMASEARYRPAAPGDGLGGIYLDRDQLANRGILEAEALRYAKHFQEEEDKREFWIGCSCFKTVRAFVYAIEAARCLCAGHDFEELAGKLLRMAARELGEGKQ